MTAAEILEALFRMNLAAGAAILAVLALRKLIRTRFGARLAYGLWLLPVLTSAAVLIPARQVHIVRAAAPAWVMAASAQPSVQAPPAAAVMSLDPMALLVGLWIAGALGAVLVMAHLQLRFLRQAQGGALGPALVGVMAPRIVTPKDFAERYSPGEQTLVLAHERTHLERQDSRLNGLCAALQCLLWFNPLVHLAAHLMRIDQELACDETVVTRFPDARRAYAEVLVKAQLATLPLPLGCYWPSKTAHPLVERIAMLKRKGVGRAHRSAGAAALAVLCAGAGFAAWASQPPDIRITVDPADELQAAAAPQAPAAPPRPERIATRSDPGAQTPDQRTAAPEPAENVATNGSLDQTPSETVASSEDVTPSAPISSAAEATPPSISPAPQAQPTLAPNAPSPSLARLKIPAQPTGTKIPANAGEANCYLDFGQLHCDRLPASPTNMTSTAVTAEPPIIVAGLSKPELSITSATLRAPAVRMIRASAASAAADDPDRTLCKVEAITGSRFIRRLCMTRSQWKWRQSRLLAFERDSLIDPSGNPADFY